MQVLASRQFADLFDPAIREGQLSWFRFTINDFANVLRPRIATLAQELSAGVA